MNVAFHRAKQARRNKTSSGQPSLHQPFSRRIVWFINCVLWDPVSCVTLFCSRAVSASHRLSRTDWQKRHVQAPHSQRRTILRVRRHDTGSATSILVTVEISNSYAGGEDQINSLLRRKADANHLPHILYAPNMRQREAINASTVVTHLRFLHHTTCWDTNRARILA